MVRYSKRALSLIVQAKKLKLYFPDSEYSIKRNRLIWKGYIQPTYLSPKYHIKIVCWHKRHPNVYVLDPYPLPLYEGADSLEHVYDTKKQHLCIYYKKIKEWDINMFIADTIIPWTSEWLLHYELWLVTGCWHGGGVH